MVKRIKIGNKFIGDSYPVFITAEIGINHNGDINLCKKLIDMAVDAGCSAVKFQKRTPELCVPEEQKNVIRETPWGKMTYLDYKNKIEFGYKEYKEIDKYCKKKKIIWFASPWDLPSVDFLEKFNVPCYKISSASLTDKKLLKRIKKTKKPIILSSGMSTLKEIDEAIKILGKKNLILLHCNSSYPAKTEELNLKVIPFFKKRFGCLVGYSGHESGVYTTLYSIILGACFVERHITLDRASWGTDQSASLEKRGIEIICNEARLIKSALGNGIKKVYDSEKLVLKKLRMNK